MCSVSRYCSWQTFDRNASLDTEVLLVSDPVSAVSGTQEHGKCCDESDHDLTALCSTSGRPPVPDQDLQAALCAFPDPQGRMQDVRRHVAAQPLSKCFPNLPPFAHSVLWNTSGFPSYQYMIWILESLFSAVLKISLFILFFESVMVMNKNWSLVYSATEFFPTKLYSLLPIF